MRWARFAVLSIFFLNGFGFASWVVRIPAVQESVGVGAGALGLALLGLAGGALFAMPTVGALISRFGSRPVTVGTLFLFAALLALPTLAGGLAPLFLALLVVGVSAGGLDVSMNAHAVAVEKRYERPIMSSFHGFFSLGGLFGAVTGGVVAELGVGPTAHLAGVAAITALAGVFIVRHMLPASEDRGTREEGAEPTPTFVRPTRALLGLGMISFCVLVGEGAMADWSAVYLSGTLGTGPGFAAAGYAVFSLAMTVARFTGDRVTARVGAKRIVRGGASLAAVGLAAGLLAGNPYLALLGFGCAGLGFAVIFPIALSAAGHARDLPPGPALAAVATAGYFGFLVGPPTIGFAAEIVGLGGALFIVVALSATVSLLAGTVEKSGKKKPASEAAA
ncbi:MFS transporter [Rubrobacter radiotolerans]|uniref:MFS transporter n=1 Tax=Rubrobacter radiotolerans TaxID=42256 RepID=UPI0009D36413|nr:MFS transporter [Rubrobacter radiotolerans]SMC06288.1 Fucose permease [Rubrobacter radiotolerans DSM 5868]